MNITPAQRTITEFHLALSEADAEQARSDPHAFGERLAEQLRALSVSSNGHDARVAKAAAREVARRGQGSARRQTPAPEGE